MENELPKRKSTRLQGLDYSSTGAYFITICTHNRENILSNIVWAIDEGMRGSSKQENIRCSVGALHEAPVIELSKRGLIIKNVVDNLPDSLNVKIDKYIIMPNHIHIIAIIKEENKIRAIRESPLQVRSVISKAVGYIKMNASKEIHRIYGNTTVWQRGFHDHIIRDREDYERHVRYICENPQNWMYDELYGE